MAEEEPMSQETFLILANAAGIDVSGSHGEELLAFVRNALSSIEPLHGLEVSDTEPDMAFLPRVG